MITLFPSMIRKFYFVEYIFSSHLHDHPFFYSFRRTRLNWPESIPDPYDDEPNHTLTYLTPLSLDQSTLKQVETPTNNAFESFNGQYRRDELTHVRTIRVFEATKADEHSLVSMFSSRTPSP